MQTIPNSQMILLRVQIFVMDSHKVAPAILLHNVAQLMAFMLPPVGIQLLGWAQLMSPSLSILLYLLERLEQQLHQPKAPIISPYPTAKPTSAVPTKFPTFKPTATPTTRAPTFSPTLSANVMFSVDQVNLIAKSYSKYSYYINSFFYFSIDNLRYELFYLFF